MVHMANTNLNAFMVYRTFYFGDFAIVSDSFLSLMFSEAVIKPWKSHTVATHIVGVIGFSVFKA